MILTIILAATVATAPTPVPIPEADVRALVDQEARLEIAKAKHEKEAAVLELIKEQTARRSKLDDATHTTTIHCERGVCAFQVRPTPAPKMEEGDPHHLASPPEARK